MDKWKIFYGLMALFAILTLLVGLLIPTVPHHGCGEVSATKAQLSNYVTAIQMYRGEYGYFPHFFEAESELHLSEYPNSELLIQGLSARNKTGDRVNLFGNRRGVCFYSFTENEFTVSESTGYRQILDRTGNTNIIICIDHDGDKIIEVPNGDSTKELRATVTAYTLNEAGEVAIRLWD